MFRARELVAPERFTFHSSRMRMKKVTQEELAAMDAESLRCAAELTDARVDVMGYACLVAIMCMGKGYHCTSEGRLHEVTVREGYPDAGGDQRRRAGGWPEDPEGAENCDGRTVHEAADAAGRRLHRG